MPTTPLPLTRPLTALSRLSLLIALLLAGLSLAGLLFPSVLYPTEALRRSFVSNDLVNLLIGLPILLGAMWLANRQKLLGLLLWPGALLYIFYNYLASAVAQPFTWPGAAYLTVTGVSLWALVIWLAGITPETLKTRLTGAVPARLGGGVLVGFGALFLLRTLGQVVPLLLGQTAFGSPEQAVLAADLVTMPLWIAGGVWLWRKQALGYAVGLGLLFQGSMLFIGLLGFFLLQPVLAAAPFPAADFVVILIMGLIFFIPFGLFARGALAREIFGA